MYVYMYVCVRGRAHARVRVCGYTLNLDKDQQYHKEPTSRSHMFDDLAKESYKTSNQLDDVKKIYVTFQERKSTKWVTTVPEGVLSDSRPLVQRQA